MSDDDFSGLYSGDENTTSALVGERWKATPITAETIAQAMQLAKEAWDRPPAPPCGTEENPHITPPAKVGEAATCIFCGGCFVYTSEGRGFPLVIADMSPFKQRPALRLTLPEEPPFVYRNLALAMPAPRPVLYMSVGYDSVGYDDVPLVRWPRRLRRPNRSRSSQRTDFGRRP